MKTGCKLLLLPFLMDRLPFYYIIHHKLDFIDKSLNLPC